VPASSAVQPQQEERRRSISAIRPIARRIEALIATADVVSENFRPGALKKYGLRLRLAEEEA
jgi:hypothetical protein